MKNTTDSLPLASTSPFAPKQEKRAIETASLHKYLLNYMHATVKKKSKYTM